MKDLESRDDCRALVKAFYDTVRRDALLGPVFEGRMAGRWGEHLDRMTEFWAAVLLGEAGYSGRPLERHLGLPIGLDHFGHWLGLWHAEVDRLFSGPRATRAKEAAVNISLRMSAALGLSVPSARMRAYAGFRTPTDGPALAAGYGTRT